MLLFLSFISSIVKNALGKGKNIQVLCKEMADFIKNLIMIKVGVGDYSILDILPGEYASYVDIANMFDINYLKNAFSAFAKVELDLKYSLNPENLFETTCLGLMDFSGNVKVENVPSQIQPKVQAQPVVTQPTRELTEIEKIWGNVLLKVKENNMFALANALTNVNKVSQIGKNLIISTNDLGSYEMIDNTERISVLLKLVKLFDDDIEQVVVEYDKTNASTQDIKDNLKDVFKSKIKFK